MGELLVNNLAGILGAAALFLTALGTFINIIFTQRNRHEIAETKTMVGIVEKKVDDGAKDSKEQAREMQRAISEIAKKAVDAATAPRTPRASDLKPDT